MAQRGLKVGTIIDKTLGVLELGAVPVLLYLVVISALGGTVTYFTQNTTAPLEALGAWLVTFVVSISAAYLLIDALVRRTGLRTRTEADVFVPYIGLSILYTLGVLAGFILIILPGLWIMARWIIAQPLLVARGAGIKEALGESWEATNGAEFSIIGAALALAVAPVAVMIAGAMVFESTSPAGVGVSQLASTAISVLLMAMGVAIYGLIESRNAAAKLA